MRSNSPGARISIAPPARPRLVTAHAKTLASAGPGPWQPLRRCSRRLHRHRERAVLRLDDGERVGHRAAVVLDVVVRRVRRVPEGEAAVRASGRVLAAPLSARAVVELVRADHPRHAAIALRDMHRSLGRVETGVDALAHRHREGRAVVVHVARVEDVDAILEQQRLELRADGRAPLADSRAALSGGRTLDERVAVDRRLAPRLGARREDGVVGARRAERRQRLAGDLRLALLAEEVRGRHVLVRLHARVVERVVGGRHDPRHRVAVGGGGREVLLEPRELAVVEVHQVEPDHMHEAEISRRVA
mmetsp:Transcript_19402/g.57846  ORF Transcript_19402/g.57846 Transcript_19402/m.57846 type:complete len:304 (-) Transcript_19402:191-1102(-)